MGAPLADVSLAQPEAAEEAVAEPGSEPTLSGFYNGLFYLRDRTDVFRLYVQGRVHVDGIKWLGPGVGSLGPLSALKTTLQLRRARLELAGEFFQDWQWQLGVDLAPTATDNASATTDSRSCAVDATGTLSCADATNAVEAPLQRPAITDAFVNYGPSPWVNFQAGQYLIPFTMENRVSDNTTPFLERSLVARGLGAPFTRDIGAMFWGQEPKARAYYSIGLYNGDGANRANSDNRFDLVSRVFARPLADGPFRDAQVGASGRIGSRDPQLVGYDVPWLTTQGGYVFWRAMYIDSLNRTIHILPSAEQGAVAGDVYVPFEDRFDFTAEAVYAVTNTRETADNYQLSRFTERTTRLTGYAYYAQVGAWVVGSREIVGTPSYGKPLHLDLTAPPKRPARGVQLLAKFERLHLTYSGPREGALDPKTPLGDIDLYSFAIGASFWATRHMRVAVNYSFFAFPDSEPVTASSSGGPVQSASQRALAPAQLLTAGADNDARDHAHTLHELQMRVGVQF